MLYLPPLDYPFLFPNHLFSGPLTRKLLTLFETGLTVITFLSFMELFPFLDPWSDVTLALGSSLLQSAFERWSHSFKPFSILCSQLRPLSFYFGFVPSPNFCSHVARCPLV
jgi:hypothetical protein